MSKQTWEEEFYPIHAWQAAGTVKEAIEHSLRKWKGLTKENLNKHKLHTDEDYHLSVLDEENEIALGVYGESCALCCYAGEYIDQHGLDYEDCGPCPLNVIDNCNRVGSAYNLFLRTGNPEPMIANLRQCLVNINDGNGSVK